MTNWRKVWERGSWYALGTKDADLSLRKLDDELADMKRIGVIEDYLLSCVEDPRSIEQHFNFSVDDFARNSFPELYRDEDVNSPYSIAAVVTQKPHALRQRMDDLAPSGLKYTEIRHNPFNCKGKF